MHHRCARFIIWLVWGCCVAPTVPLALFLIRAHECVNCFVRHVIVVFFISLFCTAYIDKLCGYTISDGL